MDIEELILTLIKDNQYLELKDLYLGFWKTYFPIPPNIFMESLRKLILTKQIQLMEFRWSNKRIYIDKGVNIYDDP